MVYFQSEIKGPQEKSSTTYLIYTGRGATDGCGSVGIWLHKKQQIKKKIATNISKCFYRRIIIIFPNVSIAELSASS